MTSNYGREVVFPGQREPVPIYNYSVTGTQCMSDETGYGWNHVHGYFSTVMKIICDLRHTDIPLLLA